MNYVYELMGCSKPNLKRPLGELSEEISAMKSPRKSFGRVSVRFSLNDNVSNIAANPSPKRKCDFKDPLPLNENKPSHLSPRRIKRCKDSV